MNIRLTSGESRAFRELLQVLSTPLDYEDSVAWRAAALGKATALFGVERGMFMVPLPDAPVVTRAVDDAVTRSYMGDYITRDVGIARAMRTRVEVASQRGLYGPELEELEIYHDLFRPNDLVGGVMAIAHVGHPCAFLAVPDGRMHTDPAREKWGLAVMEMAWPVFHAGVRLELKARGARTEVERLFTDTLEPAALFSAAGAEVHRNAAFDAALLGEEEAATVCAAAAQLARAALALSAGVELEVGCPAAVELRTRRACYRLSTSVLGESLLLREPVAVVWLGVERADVPAADWREQFGFTAREAEVAELIARGCTTRQIAERLGISWHTTRRHTERVLAKMNVSTRSAAAGRILGGS